MNQFVVFDDNGEIFQVVNVDSINIDGNNVTWNGGSSLGINANFGLFVSGNANVGDILSSGNALSIAKATKITQLSQQSQSAIYDGFDCVPDTTTGVSYHFPFDVEAQNNYTQYIVEVLSGATISQDWKVMDSNGNWITLTITSTNFQNNVRPAAASFKINMINKYRYLESQVNASTTISQVKAITY